MRVPDDVGGDDRVLDVLHDPGHRPLGRRPDCRVDLLHGDIAVELDHQVDGRAVGDRDPHRHPVELSGQLGHHLADGRCGPGGGGDDVLGGCPASTQVFVRDIGQDLIVGVGVHGGHHSLADPEAVVQHLGQGSKRVGGARGVGHDDVPRVELIVVDSEDDGLVDLVLGGDGEDHPLGAGIDVLLQRCPVTEHTCRLDHDVDLEVGPGESRRIALHQHLHLVLPDRHQTVLDGCLFLEPAHHRVVLEQVGEDVVVGEVVDGDHVEPGVVSGDDDPEHCPADAAEAIDCDVGHFSCLHRGGLRPGM